MKDDSEQPGQERWRALREAHIKLKECLNRAERPEERAFLECALDAAERAMASLLAKIPEVLRDLPAVSRPLPEPKIQDPLSILVVEDNIVNQRTLELMLLRAGHSSVAVDNGRAAIELVERQTFDIVILDLVLPDVSGIETLETIRAIEVARDKRTPIVALTSLEINEVPVGEWIGLLDAYLTKPLHAKKFFHTLSRVIARRRLLWLAEMPLRMNDADDGDFNLVIDA